MSTMAATGTTELEDNDTLETLLNKATNPMNREEDWEFILSFCDRVNFELEGPQIACRLIGHKIQSPQERESYQALIVAEACVKNCGENFHREVGKFRFLNELIKLISPKYLGGRTSEKVKQKTIEIMYAWQRGLPQEPKIKEAYEMLKKQGLVTEDPVYVDETFEIEPAAPRMADFEDEDKAKLLSRLLKSKHAEDLQAANRLIKNMVKEEEKKTEKLTKRMNDLESCNNNVKLLGDMLSHYDAQVTSDGERDLMKELYQTCERMRPNLFRLASDTDEQDDGIADILRTNDALVKVMEDYKARFGDPEQQQNNSVPLAEEATPAAAATGPPKSSLIDLGSSPVKSVTNGTTTIPPPLSARESEAATSVAGDLSLLDLNASTTSSANNPVLQRTNPSDLDNILGTSTAPSSVANVQAINASQQRIPFTQAPHAAGVSYPGLAQSGMGGYPYQPNQQQMMQAGMYHQQPGMVQMNMAQHRPPMQMAMGQPVSNYHMAAGAAPLSGSRPQVQSKKQEPAKPVDTFADLANLGKSMVIQPKVPETNEATKGSVNPVPTQNNSAAATPAQTGAGAAPFTKPSAPVVQSLADITVALESVQPATQVQSGAGTAPITKPPAPVVESLADITVALESVQPGEVQPITAYEKNKVKTVIHFGKDTPRPDVTVMVVSTMSTNTVPVKHLSFQAAVPKSMRVKLQPPSATDLPAFNPILPPAAITQVMLLANPQKEKVRLKFKLQYSVGEENFTDIGEISSIPS